MMDKPPTSYEDKYTVVEEEDCMNVMMIKNNTLVGGGSLKETMEFE